MEHIETYLPVLVAPAGHSQQDSTERPFIQANTIAATVEEVKQKHIIPVFIKDNETLISHTDFVEAAMDVAADIFHGETILKPSIRLSHPIKGRIPDAKDKPVHRLEEWEKTLYYERMAFIIEVPTIWETIAGNAVSLTIGGVKSYSLDNLYNRKGADEHFKVFVGFQNKVCTNLCVNTDGVLLDLKVKSLAQLSGCIRTMLSQYNMPYHLHSLKDLTNYAITEQQFAQLVGRCRMYPYLPQQARNEIPQLLFGDTQIGTVVRDFYRDGSFGTAGDGLLDLWRMYNLFTGANKSTYIDQFVERGVNAFSFAHSVKAALQSNSYNWYLS